MVDRRRCLGIHSPSWRFEPCQGALGQCLRRRLSPARAAGLAHRQRCNPAMAAPRAQSLGGTAVLAGATGSWRWDALIAGCAASAAVAAASATEPSCRSAALSGNDRWTIEALAGARSAAVPDLRGGHRAGRHSAKARATVGGSVGRRISTHRRAVRTAMKLDTTRDRGSAGGQGSACGAIAASTKAATRSLYR